MTHFYTFYFIDCIITGIGVKSDAEIQNWAYSALAKTRYDQTPVGTSPPQVSFDRGGGSLPSPHGVCAYKNDVILNILH